MVSRIGGTINICPRCSSPIHTARPTICVDAEAAESTPVTSGTRNDTEMSTSPKVIARRCPMRWATATVGPCPTITNTAAPT